jgi:hypothetical protein
MALDLEDENIMESVEAFVTKLYEKSDLNGDGFLDKLEFKAMLDDLIKNYFSDKDQNEVNE